MSDIFTAASRSTDPILSFGQLHMAIERHTPRHSHAKGQLLAAEQGLMTIRLDDVQQVVGATQVVWIPPHYPHGLCSHGSFNGWSLYIDQTICSTLPQQCCTLPLSGLLREAIKCLANWSSGVWNERQQRIAAVILDEIATLPDESFSLPMPVDPRLVRIAQAMLLDLSDRRRMDEWAIWVGLSPRTLTRKFISETGFNFMQWRQRARLMRALELLADGVSVTTVALEVGYENISAFIELFQATFGSTPGKYFIHR